MKLGNNKKEVMIVKCYFGTVIIIGIILSIWLFLALDLIIALLSFGIYWFIFLISPFLGADFFEVGGAGGTSQQGKRTGDGKSDYWYNRAKYDKKDAQKYRTQGYGEYHRKKIKNEKKFQKR
ncbi:MAG: hypothetical protein KAW66_05830 [Candidatus Lokiarchaeota archaeon]|nr:hypothetical protein [Candidatus Lokiarchaeota archaeon]